MKCSIKAAQLEKSIRTTAASNVHSKMIFIDMDLISTYFYHPSPRKRQKSIAYLQAYERHLSKLKTVALFVKYRLRLPISRAMILAWVDVFRYFRVGLE